MPPETTPPDDERSPSPSSPEGGTVVDPEVLAERRAQRAEQAEQSAARRAADAQVLAAQLARERARLEAERDAARAEAAAAREGADAAIAEARHLQGERDSLRSALDDARAERDALAAQGSAASPAPEAPTEPALSAEVAGASEPVDGSANGARNGHGAPPAAWAAALGRELAVARAAAAIAEARPVPVAPTAPVPGLARERRLVALRAVAGPSALAKALPGAADQRRGDRAAPITALALERERSSRLQAQLDSSLAVQRELRTHIAALQRAVHQRVEAERRIETALRRVREELTAANAFAAGGLAAPAVEVAVSDVPPGTRRGRPSAPPRPAPLPMPPGAAATPPAPSSAAGPAFPAAAVVAPASAAPAPTAAPAGLDPLRLSAARERLRASAPAAAPLARAARRHAGAVAHGRAAGGCWRATRRGRAARCWPPAGAAARGASGRCATTCC